MTTELIDQTICDAMAWSDSVASAVLNYETNIEAQRACLGLLECLREQAELLEGQACAAE